MSQQDNTSSRGGEAETQGDVPRVMIEQAEAAAASEHDISDESAQAQRHMGHDVPAIEREDLEAEQELPDHPPPAYGEHFGKIHNEQEGFGTKANVADDGRVNININQRNRRLSDFLVPALRHQQSIRDHEPAPPPPYIPPSLGGEEGVPPPPPMNVVIHVVGSRGDVQPFVALGKVLKDTYGHRVRLATHPTFQQFVTENDLDFFSIGGDPAQLMAFMVKNPGLMPGFDSLRSGDVGMRRKEVAEYLKGCWRSCFEAGNGLGPEATDDTIEDYTSQYPQDANNRPFVADCIIANPPSFAHVHIAEKMGIPLHIMFTMPYSPTSAFPHPLANVQSSNADPKSTNYVTYALIDMLTWQGLGDVINRFREKSLGLEPISLIWAPGMLQRLQVPHTYCWSPALIPKPKDWGQNISISGFFFLNLASNYTPAPDLKEFLDAGPPPVYIGFGSIVLDDPNAMTELIFEAVRITGQRVLLSKGWGGMGAEELGIPEGVFMLDNVPHDWLFKHVSCVVHHGGAGTTAAGITAGRPTVVVPFFGDQPFWGSMVARAGAGPDPVPHRELTAQKLADAIKFCLKPESQERAQELAAKIAEERGCDVGAQSFHQMLNVDKLRCTIATSRAAVWRLRRTQVRLSAMAACTLANEGLLDFNDLKLFRPKEYETDDGPWDPVTGGSTSLIGTMTQIMMGVADLPVDTLKLLRIHPDAKKKKPSDAGISSMESANSSGEGTVSTETQTESSNRDSILSDSTLPNSVLTDTTLTSNQSTPATSRANSTLNLQDTLKEPQGSQPPESSSSERPRSSSMMKALRGELEGSKKLQKRSPSATPSQQGSPRLEPSDYLDTAVNTSKGMGRILGAAFKSPMDASWAVARGFHNAPKLYGDDTVRDSDHITDFRTGLKAAGKEFGFGMWDGITGLWTQPVKGAQKEGPAGFVKGIGKGIGGVVLKPGAAAWAIPGYTMKGIYKEMKLNSGSSVQNYIIASRTAQGFDEMNQSTEQERKDIVERWKHMQGDIKKKRNPDDIVRDALAEQRRKGQTYKQNLRGEWEEKRNRLRAASTGAFHCRPLTPGSHEREGAILNPREWMNRARSTGAFRISAESPGYHDEESARLGAEARGSELVHARTSEGESIHSEVYELNEAIRSSVQETSKGNPEEDAEVERAIRASMGELYKRRAERAQGPYSAQDEDDDLKRALAASAAEARAQGNPNPLYDEELERALAQSLREQRRQRSSDSEWDSDDDEDFKQAIQASQIPAVVVKPGPSSLDRPPEYDQGHLAGTTQREFEAPQAQQPGEKAQQERTEEEIVMEYVKKQSLLEEEHRKSLAAKANATETDENEELQQALKASMQD